jgi:hypothetical protein
MKLYIAKWPDNSLTIVTASSKRDLFLKLDEEADPSEAKITSVDFDGDVHITTRFAFDESDKPVLDENGSPKMDWDLGECAHNAKKVKVKMP